MPSEYATTSNVHYDVIYVHHSERGFVPFLIAVLCFLGLSSSSHTSAGQRFQPHNRTLEVGSFF